MHNIPYPFFNPQIQTQNIYEELQHIKNEINILKEKIKQLEQNNKKDYLKKDDSLYMI